MSALQTITDALLIESIDRASQRVVMIAPGVWPPLAKSIAAAWQRLGSEQVTVILDVDPEICRIGYGSLEGLRILQAAAKLAGEALGEEPGVRICVVIVDEQTFVFSPTPRQLEAPPGASPIAGSPQPKANGIVLSKPPAALEIELGGGPEGIIGRTLGIGALDEKKLEEVAKDLEVNPPKAFDLARAVNVYNAKIRFVELKVGGYRVSQHTVTLPKHLVNVAKKNKDLARKIDSAVKLLDSNDALVGGDELFLEDFGPKNVSQTIVEGMRNAIEETYLRPIKGVGKIIKRAQISEFEAAVADLQITLSAFSKLLMAGLAEQYRKTADDIATAILPDVLNQLPEKWLKQLGNSPSEEHVRFRIIDDLIQSFGEPDKKCDSMKASFLYKDVTYDMLKDPNFSAEVAEHFPDLHLVEEFNAVKERSPAA